MTDCSRKSIKGLRRERERLSDAQSEFMANKHTRKRPKVLGCTKPDGGKNRHRAAVQIGVNKYAGKKAKKAAALAVARSIIADDAKAPNKSKAQKKFAY